MTPFNSGPYTGHDVALMRISLWPALLSAAIIVASVTAGSTPAAQSGNRERTMFISAVDDKGEPVNDLGPDAFVIREEGRRREVLRVSRATEPIDLAIMADNSQAARDDITLIREGLSKFVAGMSGQQHRIALISLAERPTVLVSYTTDPAPLNAAIGRFFSITGSGMTLLDGLFETSRGLRKRESERAIFVPVITDGPEFTNRYSKDVVRELRESGAAVHAVTIGRFVYTDEHPIRERSFVLDEAPRATGGQRINLLAPQAVPQALERLARELSAQYKVVYGRPDSPYEWNVDVSSARKGVTMRGAPARRMTGASK